MYKLPSPTRRAVLLTWDALAWVLALLTFLLVRYDFTLSDIQWNGTLLYTAAAVALQIILGLFTQLYLGRHRVGSFAEAASMGIQIGFIAVLLGLSFGVFAPEFPRGVALMLPPVALVFMATTRFLFRSIIEARPHNARGAVPAIIYGAGNAGFQVAQMMSLAEEPPYQIVGFVDDDRDKKNLRLVNQKVLGSGRDLVRIAKEKQAQTVIFAISDASPQLIQQVNDVCAAHNLELLIIPPLREMVGGQVTLGSLRHLNVADLLGRRPIRTDLSSISDYITGRTVLVTGAGGSIGSELANQVHKLGPSKLILLDRDESALHGVQLTLYGTGLLDTDDMVLADIRDEGALQAVFETHRPEVVFHAAALKHLPLLEQYPAEGWKTNVLGTANVLRVAQETGVTNFVNISTDKAADASSVLGRSKRIAERLTAWYAEAHGLRYLSVRFGNVLGSRGSVLHTFRAQIERGGPVTVTHPDVTRYFMTIPEACELVLQAGALGTPGDVMVLDMGQPVKIVDVAERMISESGKDIEIHFTGLRPGEKMDEVLFSAGEVGATSTHPLINSVRVHPLDPADVPHSKPRREDIYKLLAQDVTGLASAPAPLTNGSMAPTDPRPEPDLGVVA